jgi:Ca2+-transporting ATPase
MERPPRRPSEGVLNAVTVSRIFVHGGFITISVLAAFTYGLYSHCLAPAGLEGMDALRHALSADTWRRPEFAEGIVKAQTLAFGNLAFCQLAHALNCRSETHSIFRLGLWSNRPLVGAILLSLAVQFLVLYVGPLQKIFHTVAITGRDVVVATLLSVSPLAFGELYKLVSRSCARAG